VLAGGAAERLGRDKSRVEIDGVSLAARAARLLWPLCDDVLISIGHGASNPVPDFPSVEDAAPGGRGPLAGIDAAFRGSGKANLVVLACDYPRVDGALLRTILSRATEQDDLVFLTDVSGRDHPLVGWWSRRAAEPVRAALAEKRYKVRALLGRLNAKRLGPAAFPGIDLRRVLLNVNWPADLEAL